MEKHILYTTEAVNQDGLNGQSFIKTGGLTVTVSNPLNNKPGTNPEQLLGLSLSTCMNATLQAIEREHGLAHTAEVRVTVTLIKEENFAFLVVARVRIPGVPLKTATKLVALAKKRCPVSKLLSGSSYYQVQVVEDY